MRIRGALLKFGLLITSLAALAIVPPADLTAQIVPRRPRQALLPALSGLPQQLPQLAYVLPQ
jgi:hypothetical protein